MQISVFKKRKMYSIISILLIIICMLAPIAVYAADDEKSEMIQEYYEYAEQVAQMQTDQQTGEIVDEAVTACETVIERLKESCDSLEKSPTITTGYIIIDNICRPGLREFFTWLPFIEEEIDGVNGYLASIWKEKFRDEAQSLGVDYGSPAELVAGALGADDLPVISSFIDSQNGDINYSAIKVNILTWNRSEEPCRERV